MYSAPTSNKAAYLFAATILLVLLIFSEVYSANNNTSNGQQNNSSLIRNSIRSSRGYSRFDKGGSAQEEGNVRYLRTTIVDGNLVTGSITNNGLLSHADLSIMALSWPKGPNLVDYIFGTYFYVAAQVVDAHGDTIAIVSDYYKFGEVAPDQSHGYYWMPLPKYFNLDEPDALTDPLVGGISEDVGLDGLPNTHDEGEGDGRLQPIEDFNSNGRLDLHMQNVVGWFATSSRKETWPEYWPAGSYPGDDRLPGEERPGVRAGRWNGEFGSYVRGDQETYYVMDDRENDEFDYYPFPGDTNSFPDGRRGLGLTVKARTYQWNARLAEDILINIYDISKPLEAKDLDTCVVGMLVDPDMGGQYYNDDADFDTLADITYTWNIGGRDLDTGLPTGYFGFAFLESPGLAFNGKDDDTDGMIDESQHDGIDNDTDWTPWTDVNNNGIYDNEDTNYNLRLDPGEDLNNNGRLDIEPLNDDTGPDGLGPEDFEYAGPDAGEANGIPDLGEPDFETTDNDESDQVGLTSAYFKPHSGWMDDDQTYWDEQLQPGTFDRTSDWQTDVAFTYGSGFVEFKNDSSNGEPKGAIHRYAIALAFGNDYDDILRNKRTIQVIYDNDYNFAKPPLQPTLTATAGDKKVYLKWDDIAERSTDPIYGKDFEAYYIYKSTDPTFEEIKTITDAFGNPLLFKPLAIFDLNDGLKGLHPVRLGSELGGSSDLGVTYNMGTDSGLRHHFIDEDVINGRTYYYAIASLDKGYIPSFFDDSLSTKQNLNPIAPTECPVNIQIDPLGRPIAFDRNTAQVIPTEMSAGWIAPQVSSEGIKHVSGFGTGSIDIQFYNPVEIKTGYSYRVKFDDNGQDVRYDSTHYTGTLNQMTVSNLTEGATLGVINNPLNNDFDEKYILEGFRVILHNDTTRFDTAFWEKGSSPLQLFALEEYNTPGDPERVQRDFEIRIMDIGADTSQDVPFVTNFQIWDVTNPDSAFKVSNFFFRDIPILQRDSILNERDAISIVDPKNHNTNLWRFDFDYPTGLDSSLRVPPQKGDVLKIITRKTFDRHDAFEFTVTGNSISNQKAKDDLKNIYVVPDPYVAVNRLERKVYNPDEGRGERRLDFVNLPRNCTISIFTASGRFVQKIIHQATEENRRATWDLRTKDGLEIASGMYFYAVEAPGIGVKTGKFAVIK